MPDTKLIDRLRDLVGAEHVSADSASLEVYSYDASLSREVPGAVVFPADTEETAAVVRELSQAGVPFVPRGFGTNLSGGSVVADEGVVLSLTRLDCILSIERENRCAVVQPGVTNLELQDALAPLGYYYAPDPASQKVATLGGNIGENSGGPHCLKYGVTTNHILGMTVVLPDGDIVNFGGPALDPPGLDLRGLMVGSEGTLGIVTELTARILPKPESVATLLVIYDDIPSAAQSVSDIIAAGIVPATLEMMDAAIIEAVEDSAPSGYPRDAAAVLIIEVDGPAAGLDQQADRITGICKANQCREVRKAEDAGERDRLWAGRRGAFGAVARLAPNYLVNDCTVPRSKLPEALARVAEISAKYDLRVGNVFHAGDGNLHPLLLFDSRDAEQVERVKKAGWEIMEACAALGGTISGEHGIGTEKRDAMRMVCSGDELEFLRATKRALDPKGLLNPGKVVPDNSSTTDDAECRGVTPLPQSSSVAPCGRPSAHDQRPGAMLRAGVAGAAELRPADADEACALIRQAAADGLSLIPMGNGSRFGAGMADGAIPLRSTNLTSIVEHDHVNQVVTVQSGVPLATLQEALEEHDQWLPVRPPLSGKHTVGGVTALNACGPDRLRYGSPRDLLLGLTFVSGKGRLIAAGGRVVKNVTGYDLTRLLTGSAGRLGFLTELTFRTLPLPDRCVLVEADGTWEQCAAVAATLLDSDLDPALVTAVPVAGGGDTPWRLRLCYEGFAVTVGEQATRSEEIAQEAGLGSASVRYLAPAEDPFFDIFPGLWSSCDYVLRADVPLHWLRDLVPHALALVAEPNALADFGCGRLTLATQDLSPEAWRTLCQLTRDINGHALLEKGPAAFARREGVCGAPRPEWKLTRKLKAALDPHCVFAERPHMP